MPSPDRLGPRQRQLLRRVLLHHGSLSAAAVRPLTRQGRSLARHELVTLTESGSIALTDTGRAAAEHLWSLTG
jgi:hypothetical protein